MCVKVQGRNHHHVDHKINLKQIHFYHFLQVLGIYFFSNMPHGVKKKKFYAIWNNNDTLNVLIFAKKMLLLCIA